MYFKKRFTEFTYTARYLHLQAQKRFWRDSPSTARQFLPQNLQLTLYEKRIISSNFSVETAS